MYLRIWEYEVPREAADRFVAAYGSRGEWARLFSGHDGFVGTELFRSADRRGRFITIDRWRHESDWTTFLQQQHESYQALDTRLAELTEVDLPLFEGAVPDGDAAEDGSP